MPVIRNTEELDSPLRPHSLYEARHSKAVRKSISKRENGRKNVCFTILYVIMTIVTAVVIGYVAWHGDFGRVLFPQDSFGQTCGIGIFRSQRYLAFFNYTSPDTLSRCVSACPNPSNGNLLCYYGINPTNATTPALIANGSCVIQLTAEPTFFYCLPTVFDVTANTTQQLDYKRLLVTKLQNSSRVSMIFNQLLYAKLLLGM